MIINPEFERNNYLKKNEEIPLFEYPRPQFARDSYLPLNGSWDYAFTKGEFPSQYQGKILIPYSPESKKSGVNRQLKADEYLFYKKDVLIPEDFNKGRILLNVGACDQVCEIFVNGRYVNGHEGGYLPFTVDISDYLNQKDNLQELVIKVQDDANSEIYGRGKQVYKDGGIWYTATSGLWQSVWLESVAALYVEKIKYHIEYDQKKLKIECDLKNLLNNNLNGRVEELLNVEILDNQELIESKSLLVKIDNNSCERVSLLLDVGKCKSWTLENPELYKVKIQFGEDKVDSYFGLRKFSLTEKNGYKVFALNNEAIFHNGLLDQGYWHESYYTPPSNKAMYDEIKAVKELGFNMLRKHIKVEPYLWYYYCDVLGILVWQDMINGGKKYSPLRIALCPFVNLHLNDKNYKKMGRSLASRNQYYKEANALIDCLFNCVSLCLWTPFNEAWGQFDAYNVWLELKKKDSSRLFDHASGWQDKKGGDLFSRHIYFRKVRMKNDKKRVLALTEFGGYSLPLKNHFFAKKKFGYKMFNSVEKLQAAYEKLYLKEIIPLIKKEGLGAIVYTELTDVEAEINGIFTYDRVLKISGEKIKDINKTLYKTFLEN